MWDSRFLGTDMSTIHASALLDCDTSAQELSEAAEGLRSRLADDAMVLGMPFATPLVWFDSAVTTIDGVPTKVIVLQGYVDVAVRATV